jgi:hypothetical protein
VGLHERSDPPLELFGTHRDLAASYQQLQADLHLDRALEGLERTEELIKGSQAIERAKRWGELRIDVVQQPPQLADPVRAFVDEHLPMRHKQSDLSLGPR